MKQDKHDNDITLNNFIASVCKASDGSVVRGEVIPSLLWQRLGCLQIWEAGKEKRINNKNKNII